MVNLDIPLSRAGRLSLVIDWAWQVFFKQLNAGRISINKESSMQLHYSHILADMGELLCILKGEVFSLELESDHGRNNIDITCGFDDTRAAIELKCFRRHSNRPLDTDMYNVWKDLQRLAGYESFEVKRFFCLTDEPRYVHGPHTGNSANFSIAEGREYSQDTILTPVWVGRWKDHNYDQPLSVPRDLLFRWNEDNGWHYLSMSL